MNITVLTPFGRKINLKVKSNDFVKDLKARLGAELNIQPEQQTLWFSGSLLEDNYTLAHCSVQENAIIHLIEIPQTGTQIKVKLPNGKTKVLNVELSDSVERVKAKIFEKEGIPIEHQNLLFGNRPLENSYHLTDYGIKQLNNIFLSSHPGNGAPKMNISVQLQSGEKIYLKVAPNDLVKDVKSLIASKVSIDPKFQSLLFVGKTLDNEHTLSFYQIQKDAVIILIEIPRHIFVRTRSGKLITLDVNLNDSVESVKKRIFEIEGIPTEQQRLLFGTRQLKNGHRLLDYGINKLSHLFLSYPIFYNALKMNIGIELSDGRKANLKVEPTDLVRDIKHRIAAQMGIETRTQSLFFAGKTLDDHRTLSFYQIQKSSVLRLAEVPSSQLFQLDSGWCLSN